MDLKIEDVADLLNVSDTTIRRWLRDGKIPAYRINHQYRFSKIEIENWVMSCKLKRSEADFEPFAQDPRTQEEKEAHAHRSGLQSFSLYRAIHKGGVLRKVKGKHKEEVIRETMRTVAPRLDLDPEVVSELLLEREEMMPTALNNGIAVPHTRDFFLEGPSDTIVVVFPEEPIEYGALDGKPVHTLFFLFSHEDKRHLHLLAKLAHLSSNEEALASLRNAPGDKEFLEYIRSWESSLG
jgi:PTS system nitrogen regulatory IIA component